MGPLGALYFDQELIVLSQQMIVWEEYIDEISLKLTIILFLCALMLFEAFR